MEPHGASVTLHRTPQLELRRGPLVIHLSSGHAILAHCRRYYDCMSNLIHPSGCAVSHAAVPNKRVAIRGRECQVKT